MLRLVLPATDSEPELVLDFEHSLASLSKWESIHERPFFGKEQMTSEETLSYFEMMCLEHRPPKGWIDRLQPEHYMAVSNHINRKYTATWFRENKNEPRSREVVTAELIYYWMITFQIPFEADQWHLNKLMTLIKVCSAKQTKPKKMSRQEMAAQQRALNAERRAALNTSG